MEAKEAFTVLSDAKTRAEYDRRQQVGAFALCFIASTSQSQLTVQESMSVHRPLQTCFAGWL